MDTVHIQTLEARYHLPPSAADQRHRLDRLLPEAVGPALEMALERALEQAGARPEEEICLREVRVPVHLAPHSGDGDVVVAWGEALAEAIVRQVRTGGPDVVRFASRRQALAGFAADVARGDLGRGWAWRQLGFGAVGPATPPAEAAAVLVRTLAAEEDGAAVVPVLESLAASGLLPSLARHLDGRGWRQLAAAALAAARWPVEVLDGSAAAGADAADEAGAEALRRSLSRSALAAAVEALPAEVADEAATARSLAALSLLAADPAPAGAGGEPQHRLHRVRRLLVPEPGYRPRRDGELLRRGARDAQRGGTGVEDSAGTEPRGGDEDRPPSRDRTLAAQDDGASRAPGASSSSADPAADLRAEPSPGDLPAEPAAESPVPRRRRGETEWGGLLFLVALAEEIDLPESLAGQPFLADRPFRSRLHRLALQLVPAAPDDPAVLAFAGLAPGSDPPSRDEEPWTGEQVAVVEAQAADLERALAAVLGAEDRRGGGSPDATPVPFREEPPVGPRPSAPSVDASHPSRRADLVHRVCRRRAEVVADPGWLEVRFSLADVSTELRRAGLDLDPGWVPWLGVVLRFVYE